MGGSERRALSHQWMRGRLISGLFGLGRLLLQPTSYLPAFDAALLQLVQALHDPVKHNIVGNECECESFP